MCFYLSRLLIKYGASLSCIVILNFSSISENEDDGIVAFRECIWVLADRVGVLSRQRLELLDRHSKAEAKI